MTLVAPEAPHSKSNWCTALLEFHGGRVYIAKKDSQEDYGLCTKQSASHATVTVVPLLVLGPQQDME